MAISVDTLFHISTLLGFKRVVTLSLQKFGGHVPYQNALMLCFNGAVTLSLQKFENKSSNKWITSSSASMGL